MRKFTPSLAQRRLVESGRLGRKSGQGWYDYGDDAERAEPHTAEPAQPPAYVVVRGRPGPRVRAARADPRGGHPGHARRTRTTAPGWSTAGRRPAGARRRPDLRGVPRRRLLRPRARLPQGHPHRPVRLPGHCAEQTLAEAIGLFQALGKDVSVIGDVPGMIVARTVARIVDLAHDAVAKGVATEEDIDTAMRLGRQLPARALRVEPQARPQLGVRPARRPAPARPLRALRAVPRAVPPRVRHRQAGGQHLMTTAKRDTYTPETLLSVAVQVFNERGYDGTSMEHLSKAAGISKSSIYHHVARQGGAAAPGGEPGARRALRDPRRGARARGARRRAPGVRHAAHGRGADRPSCRT